MKIFIVVPCFNEEAVLQETTVRLLAAVRSTEYASRTHLLYVDDGSSDGTWPLIEELSARHPEVCGLKLAHNVGHQNALWAGLEWASRRADAVLSIDADLQDDVAVIPEMLDRFAAGCDIVYGVRRSRATDTAFKRWSAQLFYKLMRAMGADVVYNHADFRLMSRRAVLALMDYPERNLFLRGMVRLLGFRQSEVYYDRHERFAGESKYPSAKCWPLRSTVSPLSRSAPCVGFWPWASSLFSWPWASSSTPWWPIPVAGPCRAGPLSW